ncbi:MAG: 16S rRNA (uracil(1498)-N(3))-methyltransferase [Rickettsiaceae bacterium]|nr:16S rRNA (uracil(1498)-N(3))-methyltransferase [Rickettsiaceae bacterium]MDP4832499.1 16S rRNA (uracil(1498)-N(3))-methyltransferase [Rickettsiaceae bacterium]MDP5020488.1 16S rRNA (uracil(1498)-N(3))-methyltransferase [Rickettsiaceae bacterium]MDP5083661.1 16S rRNA (uracil(1498)-N(3))-methyltransferase [Rickettsiaceae bacterium]
MKFSHLSRIYTTEPLSENQTIKIVGDDFHYLKSVMRLRRLELFRIFNAIDGEYLVKILEIGRSDLTVIVESFLRPVAKEKQLSLAMCIIKSDRMIEAIKSAVQLGVTKIIPIISERTQHKHLAEDRVKRCISQAIEQSERFTLTELLPEISLSELCSNNNYKQIIAACESENSSNKILNINKIEDEPIILTGPEGGFSEAEMSMIKASKNIQRVSLGNTVLRAETAAIAAISCVAMMRN